jgi:formate C-acetyltransferase
VATVTLKDIRLQAYTLDTMPLLRQLRDECVNAKAEVCIERARHITEYLRDKSTDNDPIETRYAGAVAHFLSNKSPLFFDDNLLSGTTTTRHFGAPVYPELTGMTIWPELDTISTRNKNPQKLTAEDAKTLNFEIFPYWMRRNILEYARLKIKDPEWMKKNMPDYIHAEGPANCLQLFERLVFFIAGKAGCISHTVPSYRKVLERGLGGIIAEAAEMEARLRADGRLVKENADKIEFYRAVQMALSGINIYAKNLSQKAAELALIEKDPWRRENLTRMSAVCSVVPEKPARNLREAVNCIWLIQTAIHAENINMAMSPGRLDQILYPYYRKDIDEGNITVRDALEIIGCLWLKLNDNTNLVPETAEELYGGAGTVPAVTIGGVDEDGEDAVNDLTYIMLRVTELLRTRDPSMNARYHYLKNSRQYRDRVAEVIVNTGCVPAFHNDVIDIEVLKNQGMTEEHARDYAIIGCVELASGGRSYDASSSIMLNLVSVLELALYNGRRPVTGDDVITKAFGDPARCRGFEDFRDLFEKQLRYIIDEAVKLNNILGRAYQEIMPSPLLSAFFEGPMDRGRDLIHGGALYNSSGATHIGFADTVDSLSAIQQAVFEEKRFSFDELIEALKADFKGHEKMQAYLMNRMPKYGAEAPVDSASTQPVSVGNAAYLTGLLFHICQGHENYRGGRYKPAYWTMTNHAGQGKMSGALPNGRHAGKAFASGITPVSGATRDLAVCLKAVGGLKGIYIPGGEAFNLKYPFVDINDAGDMDRFGSAVEAYFRYGGLHIQFNIMSYEMLLEARAHPEQYQELLVRVSGYSAYFRDLNDAMKDEIITRTAYDLGSGRAEPFPESITPPNLPLP